MSATIPTTMTAAVHRAYGAPDMIETVEVPVPRPGPRDVLIRVEAAALNPADGFMLRGSPAVLRLGAGLRRPRQPIRGTDVAGTVVAVGASVTDLRPGDAVLGEARGSLAQYALARADRVALAPGEVPATLRAATVMAGLAAMHGLRAARLETGQRILINGASGGIGHLAVQLASGDGAHVTAVCSTANVGWVGELGAERVVDYTRTSVLDLDEEFDVVFDNVGNHAMRDMLRLVHSGGTLLPNSGEHGPDGGPLARVAKARWLDLVQRRRVATYYSSPRRADLETLAALLASGALAPRLDTVLPLERASDAMARVMSRHAAGKVVVEVA